MFAGCESHAENWGGTLLAERSGLVWIQKSYRSGFHPARCKTFSRPDSRDVLVCLWETDHQSSAHFMLDTYDFTLGDDQHPEGGWNNLLTVDDNSVSSCWGGDGPIAADSITDYRFAPQASPPQLLVDVRVARGSKTPAYQAKCAELNRVAKTNSKKTVNVGAVFMADSKQLAFIWDGTNFVPDAQTKATMHKLGYDSEPK